MLIFTLSFESCLSASDKGYCHCVILIKYLGIIIVMLNRNVQFQKISLFTPQKVTVNSKGDGVVHNL